MLAYLCHQVVKCWKDQRCKDVLNHNPTNESSKLCLIQSLSTFARKLESKIFVTKASVICHWKGIDK